MRRIYDDQINAFMVEAMNEHDLRERSGVRWRGRVPGLSPLIANTPRPASKASFRADDFKP
ncbi:MULTISPECIES: hypothetical protein [Bradyrhizobium]|uniref:Transposase n=1 Tax=Bradyrhizobium xenonodulans TaxID=2736875 RepID=A0ABY7MHV3_9BRAD|nr:hypothetical protein [Bradyrhizobium xenonodulans]WBL78006.1 hypothetical protein I3J27_34420 [Bradyrhizobium xenonodulans]